ncbi:MAG TPA: pirin family protein [Balneolales bacterium]|nr:pirin family protein [Balneolales bacterium]
MRSIKNIHKAEYRPIDNLVTYSPLPTQSLQQIDPFLFLNHHGPQHFDPGNSGLPFGPHPHRGMETVTFIIEGDIVHIDSEGHKSTITAGGIQWMTAGRGLLHSEVSSETFKKNGGNLEILQLWVNLPAHLKMTDPNYIGLQKDDIPHITEDNGNITVDIVSGSWKDQHANIETVTDVNLSTLYFKPDAHLEMQVPTNHNIFCYIIRGNFTINNTTVEQMQLIEFDDDDKNLIFDADNEGIILFGHAEPFNESVVAGGPFVMNTKEEIHQAYQDFYDGKFGTWEDQ